MIRNFSVLTALLLSMSASVAFAETNVPSLNSMPESSLLAQGEPGRRGGRMMEQLNLTPEQQQQLQAIRSKYQPQMSQKKQTLQQEQQELSRLMAGNASESQIRSQHERVQNLREELGNLRFESLLEMRTVFTSEQRQELAEMMQQRRGQMRENRGNRAPR